MLLWGGDIRAGHAPIIDALATMGFDGVEIPVAGQPREDLNILRGCAEDAGLMVTTSTFIPPEVNPIDPDPTVRAKAVPYLKARIEEAAFMGSDILIGGIYQAHKIFSGTAPTSDEWNWSRDYLRAAAEHGLQFNVRLGLEFLNRFEVHLINTSADAARMCDDVGMDNVGVLYDTHHANIEDPAPHQAISTLAKSGHLMHMHMSESHRGTLGTGQVDWDSTREGLAAAGYDDWLVIESFGMLDPGMVGAANLWRNCFDDELQVARDGLKFLKERFA